jgi:hypothetical protein
MRPKFLNYPHKGKKNELIKGSKDFHVEYSSQYTVKDETNLRNSANIPTERT